MKKYILRFLIALLLIVAGYFLYQRMKGGDVNWSLIPKSAVVVISSEKLQNDNFYLTPDSINIKRLPFIDMASGSLSLFSWFNPDTAQVNLFLKRKRITYSFHPRTNQIPGLVLYVPIASELERRWLENPIGTGIRLQSHTYQDAEVKDVHDSKSNVLFSYYLHKNTLIISQFSDLVEDVIRHQGSGAKLFGHFARFKNSSTALLDLYTLGNDWKSWLLPDAKSDFYRSFLGQLPEAVDWHLSEQPGGQIKWQTSRLKPKTTDFSKWLEGQTGTPFKAYSYISHQTSSLFRVSTSNRKAFARQYGRWLRNNSTPSRKVLEKELGFKPDEFAEGLGSEIVLCNIDDNNSISGGKILLAEFPDNDKIVAFFRNAAQKRPVQNTSSIDQFQGYEIYAIDVNEAPEALLGTYFKGFVTSYVSFVAPYLVISNNAQTLRNYISDYENQLTWDQSPDYDSVITNNISSAQLSWVVNLNKIRSESIEHAVLGFNKNSPLLNGDLESLVLECELSGNEVRAAAVYNPQKLKASRQTLNRTFLNVDIDWRKLYDSGLAGLLNPIDGSSEILLTDSLAVLYGINNEAQAKPEAITRLNGNIATRAFKTDILNIGRQQRIFATPSKIYAIDEDENGIISTLSTSIGSPYTISGMYRIEGGRETGSRFLVYDTQDNAYVWEGFNKKARQVVASNQFDRLNKPIVAVHQLGNPLYLLTQTNGKIFLITENGNTVSGFPVDLLTRISSPMTWTENPVTGTKEITGVTSFGEVIRINTSGKVTARKQLLRPDPSAVYTVLFDGNSLDWLLLRRTISKAALLSKEGNVLFEIGNLKPDAVVQYHFFGSDNRFISVKSGNFTSIFDFQGRLLGDKPIPSDQPVTVIYQAAFYKLLIFSNSARRVQTWSIKLR